MTWSLKNPTRMHDPEGLGRRADLAADQISGSIKSMFGTAHYSASVVHIGSATAPHFEHLSGALEPSNFEHQVASLLPRSSARTRSTSSLMPLMVWSADQSDWQMAPDITSAMKLCPGLKNMPAALALPSGENKYLLLALWASKREDVTYSTGDTTPGAAGFRENNHTNSALRVPTLTASERDCLAWSARGKTTGEISQIMALSEHTVNHYFGLAGTKLNASNRTHCVAKAIKLGLIALHEIA